ncbi:MAG: hypothetical protein P8L85_18340 [Rubripirellula sp.]|nr:hypothetical protein [Rubripirellula sp.]
MSGIPKVFLCGYLMQRHPDNLIELTLVRPNDTRLHRIDRKDLA